MRLNEFITEGRVVGLDTEYVDVSGTSLKGKIQVPYQALVNMFGEPQSFYDDPQSDVNVMWEVELQYQDDTTEYGEGHEYDTAATTIYDRRYDYDKDRRIDPNSITEWNIGARSNNEAWMLEKYIRSNS